MHVVECDCAVGWAANVADCRPGAVCAGGDGACVVGFGDGRGFGFDCRVGGRLGPGAGGGVGDPVVVPVLRRVLVALVRGRDIIGMSGGEGTSTKEAVRPEIWSGSQM